MSILTVILIGITFIAVASLIALVYAVTHAEEGFEDETGYHRKQQNSQSANTTTSSPVDTGNPWDQLEGSSCPWSFKPTLGHGDFSTHQQ